MISIKMASIEDVDIIVTLFDAYWIFYSQKEPDPAAGKQFLADRIRINEPVILIAGLDAEAVGFTQLYAPVFIS